jgi:hypothetical protein
MNPVHKVLTGTPCMLLSYAGYATLLSLFSVLLHTSLNRSTTWGKVRAFPAAATQL